jgi:hypothetical protein
MTRKDYIAIAAALKSARVHNLIGESNRALYNIGVDNAVSYVADALARDNPRFDRARFEAACNATSHSGAA